MSTPAEAYRAALRAQHPERHASGECPHRRGDHVAEVTSAGLLKCACGARWTLAGTPASDAGPCFACDPRLAPDASLPVEVQAAVDAERETCAQLLDAVVAEHRAEDRAYKETSRAEGGKTAPIHGERGYFCEDFGCGSLVDLAAAIRALRRSE